MGGSSFASEKESSSYSSSKSYNIYHYDNNPRFSRGYVDDDIDSLRVNEKHEDTTTSAWFFVLPFGSFVGIYLLIAYLNRASVLRVQVYHFFVHISLHLRGFFFFGITLLVSLIAE